MMSDLIWEGRFSQPRKAPASIVVTLFGIVMLVREWHRKKACFPIVVTPFGIVMLVRNLQSPYLLLVDYQYYTL